MKYDADKIKARYSMKEAAIIADIPVSRSNMILCPVHLDELGKTDNKNTNCQLNDKYFYCHACKASGDIFEMIKGYYSSYFNKTLSFRQICKMLAGDNPEFAKEGETEDEEALPEREEFPISKEVLEFLECGKKQYIQMLKNVSDTKEMPGMNRLSIFDEDKMGNPIYTFGEIEKAPTLRQLYYEDREAFWFVTYPKLLEKKKMIIELKGLCHNWPDLIRSINHALKEYYIYSNQEEHIPALEREDEKNKLSSIFHLI